MSSFIMDLFENRAISLAISGRICKINLIIINYLYGRCHFCGRGGEMPQVMPPDESEKKYWAEKQKAYIEACKKRNEKNPPKNLLHKIGRGLWDILWYPQGPTH